MSCGKQERSMLLAKALDKVVLGLDESTPSETYETLTRLEREFYALAESERERTDVIRCIKERLFKLQCELLAPFETVIGTRNELAQLRHDDDIANVINELHFAAYCIQIDRNHNALEVLDELAETVLGESELESRSDIDLVIREINALRGRALGS